jgi:hypothetical protein
MPGPWTGTWAHISRRSVPGNNRGRCGDHSRKIGDLLAVRDELTGPVVTLLAMEPSPRRAVKVIPVLVQVWIPGAS